MAGSSSTRYPRLPASRYIIGYHQYCGFNIDDPYPFLTIAFFILVTSYPTMVRERGGGAQVCLFSAHCWQIKNQREDIAIATIIIVTPLTVYIVQQQ